MGITDRRYMSEEGSSFGTFRGHEISAVGLLIGINLAVWLVWQFATPGETLFEFMRAHFMVSADGIEHYQFHTLLTAAISHQDFYHILFNMLCLWFLGRDVEVFYGKNNAVALYVIAGVVSSLAYVGVNYARGEIMTPALGASGSVMGIIVAAAFIDPHKPMSLFGVIPMQLWLLAVIYCVGDLTGVFHRGGGDHIAHAAHLGGAAAGLLFYKLDLRPFASRGRKNSGIVNRLKNWWRGRRFRVVERSESSAAATDAQTANDSELVSTRRSRAARVETSVLNVTPLPLAPKVDPDTARRVDELLAKISREGIVSLSAEEREFLKQSSEKYRR